MSICSPQTTTQASIISHLNDYKCLPSLLVGLDLLWGSRKSVGYLLAVVVSCKNGQCLSASLSLLGSSWRMSSLPFLLITAIIMAIVALTICQALRKKR